MTDGPDFCVRVRKFYSSSGLGLCSCGMILTAHASCVFASSSCVERRQRQRVFKSHQRLSVPRIFAVRFSPAHTVQNLVKFLWKIQPRLVQRNG